jgi:hypothetical protein
VLQRTDRTKTPRRKLEFKFEVDLWHDPEHDGPARYLTSREVERVGKQFVLLYSYWVLSDLYTDSWSVSCDKTWHDMNIIYRQHWPFVCQAPPQNYVLEMLRLLGVQADAQKNPQYFPQMAFKWKKACIMWKPVLSSKYWYVTLDATYWQKYNANWLIMSRYLWLQWILCKYAKQI